jgi:CubicO group peptidase (beta-lactamase class C family)
VAPGASAPFRAVVERLQAVMAEHDVPGAALGILAGGWEEHAVFGVDGVESNAPVTPDTLFQIGSITKTYTATAMLRLLDMGRFDLDTRVRAVLPYLQLADESTAAQVTIRHLLTHTGGWWGDYFTDSGGADDAIERFVAADLRTLEQLAPVGEYVSYNNSGFILLGRLLEVLTGRRYRAALQDLVLDPLALGQSFFSPDAVERRPHALGHGSGATPVAPLFLPRNVDPAGGLWATTRDVLRYARFHLGDGTAGGVRLLRPETLGLMQTPQVPIPGQPTLRMGMNWLVQEVPGVRLVFHDGETFGQSALLTLIPDRQFALVLLTNALPGGALAAQTVLLEAMARYLEIGPGGGSSSPPPSAGQALDLPPEALAAYAGRYRVPTGTFLLRLEGDTLVASAESTLVPGQVRPSNAAAAIAEARQPVPLIFLREDLAVVVSAGTPTPIVFVRKPDGSVGWLDIGLRLVPKVGPAT